MAKNSKPPQNILFKNKRIIILFLVLAILAGICFRVAGAFNDMVLFDESIYIISALKLTHGSIEDPRLWNYEHPPIAKWLYGLPTLLISTNYEEVFNLPMNKYIWIYKAHEAIKSTYQTLRIMPLFFGILTILLVFLITKELWGQYAALWATAVASLFNHLIFFSKIAYLDSAYVFFSLLMLFLYIRYINSKANNKIKYFILFLVSLILVLGSKNPYQFPTIAFLMFSNFFVEENKKYKKMFIISILLITIIFFSLIYPVLWLKTDKVIEYVKIKFGSHSITPNIDQSNFILTSLTKRLELFPQLLLAGNTTFIFTVVILIIVSLLFLRKTVNNKLLNIFSYKAIKTFSFSNKTLFTVLAFFIIYMLFSFVANMGNYYLQIPLLLLLLLASNIYNKIPASFFFSLLFCALLLIDICFIAVAFPFHNGDINPLIANKSLTKNNEYDLVGFSQDALNFVSEEKKPLLSNNLNMLAFFNGEKYAMPSPSDENCKKEFFESLKEKKTFLVYAGNPLNPSEWFCPLIAEYVDPVPLQHDVGGFWKEYGLWRFK